MADYSGNKPTTGTKDYTTAIDNLIDDLGTDVTAVENSIANIEISKPNTVLGAPGELAVLDSVGDISNSGTKSLDVALQAESLPEGYLVMADANGRLKNSGVTALNPGGNDSVASLTDTTISSPQTLESIVYDSSTGIWNNGNPYPAVHTHSVNDLPGTMSGQDSDNVDITGGTISNLTDPMPIASGGTGKSSFNNDGLLVGTATGIQGAGIGTNNQVVTSDGTNIYWSSTAGNIPTNYIRGSNITITSSIVSQDILKMQIPLTTRTLVLDIGVSISYSAMGAKADLIVLIDTPFDIYTIASGTIGSSSAETTWGVASFPVVWDGDPSVDPYENTFLIVREVNSGLYKTGGYVKYHNRNMNARVFS